MCLFWLLDTLQWTLPFLNKAFEDFPNAAIWKTFELNAAALVIGWSHVTHEVKEKSTIQISPQNILYIKEVLHECSMCVVDVW